MAEKWLLCPTCGSKTRVKLRQDTELKNFLLFCPNVQNRINAVGDAGQRE